MTYEDFELSTPIVDEDTFIVSNGLDTQLEPVSADSSNGKVLVLEDDPTQLFLLTQHLESVGLKVAGAQSIAEARVILSEEAIRLAILDVQVPDGSGLELCSSIDEHPSLAGMPIVILSSISQEDIVRQTRAAGGCYFISKPYDPNVMLAVIEKLIAEY